MHAATTTHRSLAPHSAKGPADVLFEVSLATLAYLAYFFVRGMTETGFGRAQGNAERVIRLEKWLGLFREGAVQNAVEKHDWLVNLANWVYIWGHWPVIIVVGVWLMRSSPEEYRILRNSFLISGGIGLIVFAVFPVAPPRMLDLGLIDTVTERSDAYRFLQPPAFVNQYAAMPSLHLGWDLLIGLMLVRHARPLYVRVLGFLLPLAMAWAVVATANHFLVDGVMGVALALFGLMLATVAAQPLDRAQERVESFAAGVVAPKHRGAT